MGVRHPWRFAWTKLLRRGRQAGVSARGWRGKKDAPQPWRSTSLGACRTREPPNEARAPCPRHAPCLPPPTPPSPPPKAAERQQGRVEAKTRARWQCAECAWRRLHACAYTRRLVEACRSLTRRLTRRLCSLFNNKFITFMISLFLSEFI